MRTVIESRPKGGLSAVAEKVDYWTQEGQKRLYLIVSFLPVPNAEGKRFDPKCGSDNVDALQGAPHAGQWFHDQFLMLLRNAYPPLN